MTFEFEVLSRNCNDIGKLRIALSSDRLEPGVRASEAEASNDRIDDVQHNVDLCAALRCVSL